MIGNEVAYRKKATMQHEAPLYEDYLRFSLWLARRTRYSGYKIAKTMRENTNKLKILSEVSQVIINAIIMITVTVI
ncbi:hypothetical protein [Lacticaseibacillus rhamnosus]|uniref:hypothetical protein n=1 Tax=Lacticaseibacillus rhamnosus TaxID=47715 RepID=UPI000519A6C6|nr:hypothetical protein [Lacticaseibacillus rhamnosus]MDK7184257.1 hypothetical protein [Lacticaseibacillus rhamnosus]MDT8865489.1 hypothetical protein [Lacticaseibacillus rhamnosus]OFM44539.1 hypothetical protein HMPREF2691_11245 [Lactobacillus sp. HMSC077C11]OFN08664.1 hypothetical protein HMPREF2621_03970 [Lactobacillus sp. HMSC072E07]